MSITVTSVTLAAPGATNDVTFWRLNATSADASGTEVIKASPGAGYELCVTRLEVWIGAAITVTFGCNEVSSAPEDVLLGPMGGAAMHIPLDFHLRPLVVRADHDFVVDASGAGIVTVYVEGFTRPATGEYSATISASPSSSPSASPSASASEGTPSASPSTSESASPSPSPSASASASPSASISASASEGTPSASISASASEGTPSASPSSSASS